MLYITFYFLHKIGVEVVRTIYPDLLSNSENEVDESFMFDEPIMILSVSENEVLYRYTGLDSITLDRDSRSLAKVYLDTNLKVIEFDESMVLEDAFYHAVRNNVSVLGAALSIKLSNLNKLSNS